MKKSTFNLKTEVKKMMLVLASITDGIVITDHKGEVVFANPSAEALIGSLRDEMIGQPAPQVLKFTAPLATPEKFIEEALEGWRVVQGGADVKLAQARGSPIPVALTAAPLYGEELTLQGLVIVIRDLTEETRLKERQREFLTFVSHQLRLPLGSFRWGIEILLAEEEKLPPLHKEIMHDLYGVTLRLIEFVGELLEISRLERGELKLEPQPVDIAELIREVLGDFTQLVTSFNIKVITPAALETPDGKLGRIFVDPRRFKDVIKNLISNGIIYNTQEGTLTIGARIITREDARQLCAQSVNKEELFRYLTGQPHERYVLLSVADTGMGIPEKEQPHIFQSFFRAHNAVSRRPEGSGTGLFFTKSIVEASGGKIFFTSEENKGTTFFVLLPLATPEVTSREKSNIL